MSERPHRSRVQGIPATSPFELTTAEAGEWAGRFGVAEAQVRHDHVLSHLLTALAPHADALVFYGGTALSRTFLPDLRLSEDIDLLTVGPRRDIAPVLDETIRTTLEPGFGPITADPWLADARRDTQASVFRIADTDVRIQLIDGRTYTPWPTQPSTVSLRYRGLPDVTMTTLTGAGFVCAKTVAWCDETRNAPRDLYDLWALDQHGLINTAAADLFKRLGPTGGYPRDWMLPAAPPTETEWQTALAHQCIPQVTAAAAHEAVTTAWQRVSRHR